MARMLTLWHMNPLAPWPKDPVEAIKLRERMWSVIEARAPIVGMFIAVSLPPTLRGNPIVFGIFVAGLPLFVLGFLFWLRKKDFFKSMKMSWTDKEM